MSETALKRVASQPHKTLAEVCLSLDGKRIIFVFENGEGCRILRQRLPGDDGSPVTHIEVFDHGCAVAIHQASGACYDLPWDSIKHYARGGKRKAFSMGKRIAEMRRRLKLSQGKLAWRTGLSRIQISRLEQNRSEPSLDTVEKMAKAFGLTAADFISH